MGMPQFGQGLVWISGRGNTGDRKMLGALTSFKIDYKPSVKTMKGAMQVPMYAGTDGMEIKFEGEFEQIDMRTLIMCGLGQLVSGGVAGLSVVPTVDDPSQTVTTNTMTITGATDVLMVRTPIALGSLPGGSPLVKVTTAPASGQFSVSGNVVTFNAADATAWSTASVKPLVTWVKTATTDTNKVTLINANQQQTPYIGIEALAWYDGKYRWHRYPRCVATAFPGFENKGDFAKSKLEGFVMADPETLAIGEISLTEGT